MAHNAILSGSTNGRPIAVETSLVTCHTGVAGELHSIDVTILNSNASAQVITIDIGGVTAAFVLGTADTRRFLIAIAGAELLKVSGSVGTVKVIGSVEISRIGGKPGSI